MDPHETDIDSPLRAALRRGRELSVPGFADRAIVAVQRDVRRRRVIRQASFATPLVTAAAALLLYIGTPTAEPELSEQDIVQVAALHASVAVELPQLDDATALAWLVVADFEESIGVPRLEGWEETIAELVLADS